MDEDTDDENDDDNDDDDDEDDDGDNDDNDDDDNDDDNDNDDDDPGRFPRDIIVNCIRDTTIEDEGQEAARDLLNEMPERFHRADETTQSSDAGPTSVINQFTMMIMMTMMTMRMMKTNMRMMTMRMKKMRMKMTMRMIRTVMIRTMMIQMMTPVMMMMIPIMWTVPMNRLGPTRATMTNENNSNISQHPDWCPVTQYNPLESYQSRQQCRT